MLLTKENNGIEINLTYQKKRKKKKEINLICFILVRFFVGSYI
jgi:hypothetical protein